MTSTVLHDKRLLVTGASGQIASALCKRLAASNQVWGAARFGDQQRRAELAAAGVRTCPVDLVDGDLSALPGDIDHVLHLAAYMGSNPDTDYSIDVNAVATGRVLSRYRHVQSALVMSTSGVYRAHPDPWHPYAESDPLGDPASPASPAYGVSKVAQEAVAKFCARDYGLPVVIARMNVAYGPAAVCPPGTWGCCWRASRSGCAMTRRPTAPSTRMTSPATRGRCWPRPRSRRWW